MLLSTNDLITVSTKEAALSKTINIMKPLIKNEVNNIITSPIIKDSKIHKIETQPKSRLQQLTELGQKCGDKLLVVNVHVPKTGGTLVAHALGHCANIKKKKFLYGHNGNFERMSPIEKSKVLAVDAHMGYGMHLHQKNFPEDRKNCTVYVTLVRSFNDIVWSAFLFKGMFSSDFNISMPNRKHNEKFDVMHKRNDFKDFSEIYLDMIKSPEYGSPYDVFSYKGSVSYQYCCYHDFQHPIPEHYDANGRLISKIKNRWHPIAVESFKTRPLEDVDPTCPSSHEERMQCGRRRLCNDFAIVGDINEKDSVRNFFTELGAVMQCNLNQFANGRRANEGKPWRPFDDYAIELLSTHLSVPGGAEDSALMSFGKRVAANEIGVCHEDTV